MKTFRNIILLFAIVFFSQSVFAQRVLIGPRLSGNFNIFNAKNLTGTWNGLGIGVGGTVDMLFSKSIGLMVNLTAFDMKNFSTSVTAGNATTETSFSLAYLTIDPMFKAEFSGFYMVGGPSLGIKLNSSGESTTTANPTPTPVNIDTKSVRFDFAVGTGYTFRLSQDMFMGTDFMAYIPVTDTYNIPGRSNSVFSLKLGVALKFQL